MHPRIRLLCHVLLLVGVPAVVFLPGMRPASPPPALQARSTSPGTWSYIVRHDDVLTVVAQRELGTFRRYDEILALNPGIQPRALRVGSILKMPPRHPSSPRRPPPAAPAVAPPGPRGLLPLLLGMLGLAVLVYGVTRYLERRVAMRGG